MCVKFLLSPWYDFHNVKKCLQIYFLVEDNIFGGWSDVNTNMKWIPKSITPQRCFLKGMRRRIFCSIWGNAFVWIARK